MGPPRQLFGLGVIVATLGAIRAFAVSGDDPYLYLLRHSRGDWGDLMMSDWRANDQALQMGGRVFSSYRLTTGNIIWIITEADRSSTCILLREEFS
jgi:hypothetical protein